MRTVFDAEGPVYRLLSRWAELILIGFVWAVLSLPLITAPAAVGWLCHAVRVTRAGEPVPYPRQAVGYVRDRFGASLRLAAVLAGVVTLVVIALLGPSPGGWYGQLVFVVGCLVAVTAALVGPWAVALLDQQAGVRSAIVAAYRRTISQLSLALLSSVSLVAAAAAVLFAPGWIRLIVLVAAPGLAAAAVTRLCDLAGDRTPFIAAPRTHRLGKALS
jgi:hypothetical protein